MYLTLLELANFTGARSLNTLKDIIESVEFSNNIQPTFLNGELNYRLDTATFKEIRIKCSKKEFTRKFNVSILRNYFKRQNIHQLLAREEFSKLQTNKNAYRHLVYSMCDEDLFRLFCAVNRKYVNYDTPANRLLYQEWIEKNGEIECLK